MKNEKILWHINSKICINESYFVCACVFILFLGASQTEQNVKTIETTFFLNICDCKSIRSLSHTHTCVRASAD